MVAGPLSPAAAGTAKNMHVPAFAVRPFKHAGYQVALRGNNTPAHGAQPRLPVVYGVAEGAAEDVAKPLRYVSHLRAGRKGNAFYKLALLQKAAADRAGFKAAFPPTPLFAEPTPFARKERASRKKRKNQIRDKYPQKEKRGVNEYQCRLSL